MGRRRTKFLGFMIGGGKVLPLKNKVEAIQRIQAPRTKRDVQRLLEMIGYYRRFIPQYSEITAPITDLTRGTRGKELEWTEECEAALETLKLALSQPPVLATPRFELPFIVHMDASGRGLGAVLSQEQDGEEKPIMFLSRKLNEAERKYSTIEREALAVKWAVTTLKYYLLGAPFTLVTDHAPLTWLRKMKDSNARLTRWYLSLQPFAFQIHHRRGVDHSNADFLSRQESDQSWRPGDVAPVLPGGECEGEQQTPEEEVAEAEAKEAAEARGEEEEVVAPFALSPPGCRPRRGASTGGLTWKPPPEGRRGSSPGSERDNGNTGWLNTPPSPLLGVVELSTRVGPRKCINRKEREPRGQRPPGNWGRKVCIPGGDKRRPAMWWEEGTMKNAW